MEGIINNRSELTKLISDRSKLTEMQNKNLFCGKTVRAGLLERISLIYAGRRDGKHEIPAKGYDGKWTSPFLQREIASYEEFAARSWGHCHVECQELFISAETLINDIEHKEQQLKAAQSEKKGVNAGLCSVSTRRKGEEGLTDSQVATRRNRENAETLAPVKGKISKLRADIAEDYNIFFEILNTVIEVGDTFEYVCGKVKNKSLQRSSIYWDAMLRNSAKKAELPRVIEVELAAEAEKTYKDHHGRLMEIYTEYQQKYQTFLNQEIKEEEE